MTEVVSCITFLFARRSLSKLSSTVCSESVEGEMQATRGENPIKGLFMRQLKHRPKEGRAQTHLVSAPDGG